MISTNTTALMDHFSSSPNDSDEVPVVYQKYTHAWYKHVWIPKHGIIPKRKTADGHLQPVLQIVNENSWPISYLL